MKKTVNIIILSGTIILGIMLFAFAIKIFVVADILFGFIILFNLVYLNFACYLCIKEDNGLPLLVFSLGAFIFSIVLLVILGSLLIYGIILTLSLLLLIFGSIITMYPSVIQND